MNDDYKLKEQSWKYNLINDYRQVIYVMEFRITMETNVQMYERDYLD